MGWRRRAATAIVVAVMGCGSSEVPFKEEPSRPPKCMSDDDCVVVDVFCGGRSAEHRAISDEVLAEYTAEAAISECERAPWAPPERLEAHCDDGFCLLDTIEWPELAACTQEEECALVEDPCQGDIPIAAPHVETAHALLRSEERAELCRSRTPWLRYASASCRQGFCRGDEPHEASE